MAEPTVYAHNEPIEILPDVLFVHGRMRMGPGMLANRNMVAVRLGPYHGVDDARRIAAPRFRASS